MGLRRGLFLGILAGAAAAAVMKARRAEAPTGPALTEPGPEPEAAGAASDLKNTLDRIKRQAEQALDAAHAAREEKEAELQRQFDEAKRGRKKG